MHRRDARDLVAIAGRRSWLEIGAYVNGQSVGVLGYVPATTRAHLLGLMRDHADTLLAYLPTGDDPPATFRAGTWTLGPIVVRRTGRTERDAARGAE